ncbi:MAG: helix-turn-helix domain-containing protein [Mariprofundus sp.]|nr:helix-turn-helix domain-containing protein [Mariprofundus sp.]
MSSQKDSGQEHAVEAEPTARQALLQEIGSKLAQAREACQQSIDKPARKLKLQKRHLEALESGNWETLPDDVYVLGFLRQYSHYLNVDLSDEIHRLKNNQYTLTKPLTFPDPPVAPSRQWAWIAGSGFVLLFIVFNVTTGDYISDNNSDIELPPAAIETEVAADTNTDANPALEAADTINKSQAQSVTTAPVTTTPASKEIPVSEPVRPTETAKPATHSKPQQTANTHLFRFDAVGAPVWLQISLPNDHGTDKGKLLKEVLLQSGFHVSIKAKTDTLWISCGNAPALRITVDGTIAATKGSLGTGKKILRNYPFSIRRN